MMAPGSGLPWEPNPPKTTPPSGSSTNISKIIGKVTTLPVRKNIFSKNPVKRGTKV